MLKHLKPIITIGIIIFSITILGCNNPEIKENEDTTIKVNDVTRINSVLNNPEIQMEDGLQIGYTATKLIATTPTEKKVEKTTMPGVETQPETKPEATTETEAEVITEPETEPEVTTEAETTTVETEPETESPRTYEGITAKYNGDNLQEGDRIDKNKITVISQYSDGYTENVPVSDFKITPATVLNVGSNKITIAYAGKTTTINIVGISLEPEVTAEAETTTIVEPESIVSNLPKLWDTTAIQAELKQIYDEQMTKSQALRGLRYANEDVDTYRLFYTEMNNSDYHSLNQHINNDAEPVTDEVIKSQITQTLTEFVEVFYNFDYRLYQSDKQIDEVFEIVNEICEVDYYSYYKWRHSLNTRWISSPAFVKNMWYDDEGTIHALVFVYTYQSYETGEFEGYTHTHHIMDFTLKNYEGVYKIAWEERVGIVLS